MQITVLAWRVLNGLHKSITLSFLLVGHTKFSPDRCFGLLKRQYHHTDISSLDDIAMTIKSSSAVNAVQLVGTQDDTVIVPSLSLFQ